MNFSDSNEIQLLAGEYALGVLSPEDHAEFEKELERNQALASAVARWHDRLLALSPPLAPVEPSPWLWNRIEQTLPKSSRPRSLHGIWDSLYFWRASGLAGVLASAILAIGLLTTAPDRASLQYVAVLQGENAGASFIVEISDEEVHLRPLTKIAVPPGKALQFWTKPEGAAGPTSLGLVSPDQKISIPLHKLPGIALNQLFEVTLEPEAGSPIDRPTGAILALGKAVPL